MYYLESRYYHPGICRFINADSQINNDIVGCNLFVYCGNSPINRVDPTGHAFGFIIGAIVGGIIGGITAASGKSVIAGVVTGAVTGAVIGGICDGTTWAVGAVVGAMAKCATVAAFGNAINQYANYEIERQQYNESQGGKITSHTAVSNTSSATSKKFPSFIEYIDTGAVAKSAVMTAAFVPLSVGGGTMVNAIFDGVVQNSMNSAAQFIGEAAICGDVSMLQTAAEFIISIFEP